MQLSKTFSLIKQQVPAELMGSRRFFAATASNEYDLAVIGGGPGGTHAHSLNNYDR